MNKKKTLDERQKLSLHNDVNVFIKKYNGDFDKFWKNYNNKSNLLKSMFEYSCKMTVMLLNSFLSKGPLIMFSNYVKMEGLEILKIYMNLFGFSEYGKERGKDFFRFTEYHGSISVEDRKRNRKAFNNPKNIDGSVIKIILISPVGSEGISLINVRQVHILEPYWNEIRIDQLIARAVRQCSHKDLPRKERIVDIFRYYAIRKNKITTADEDIRNLANKKELTDSFLIPVKQIAVDCELNKEHNIESKDEDYTCFKFNEEYYL